MLNLTDRIRPILPATVVCATLALALTFLVAPLASAATPVERHQAWTSALQEVLIDTSLTAEQVSAVHGAIRQMDSGDFGDRLDEVDREKFRSHADALLSTLSCQTYGDLVEDLGGVTQWLAENEVVVAIKKCNCSGDSDCAEGYFCRSINCTSEVGTRNWGRCDEVEALPTEPVAGGVLRLHSP